MEHFHKQLIWRKHILLDTENKYVLQDQEVQIIKDRLKFQFLLLFQKLNLYQEL